MDYDLCVIGGFGHVGLPLSIAFADKGLKVCAFDIDSKKISSISKGKMPFFEEGADELLEKVLRSGMLSLSADPDVISKSRNIIMTIGTPVDMHVTPKLNIVEGAVKEYIKYLREGQLLVLRSTLYPGTTNKIYEMLKKHGKKIYVAFCPERIVEGKALKELAELPQIVSSPTAEGAKAATELFRNLTSDIVVLKTEEAELAKLYTNAWRYIKFATANQFFTMANEIGVDFYNIYNGMKHNYPRALDMPGAGLASGPCLFKDTVQLNSFYNNNFIIGNAAIMINEGLPFYIVTKLKQKHGLKSKRVGLLGMAYKGEIDDPRDSLAYKLKELLEYEARELYCSDPYIKEDSFVDMDHLIEKSDIIIISAPHKRYAQVKFPDGKKIIDIWNLLGNGCVF